MANIIVRFNNYSSTHNVAPYCDQWEKNQIMEIAGLDLSSPITVTFACSGKAASVTGNAKAIQIPNSLLEIGKDIVATFTANDVAYTVVIPVVPQSKPIPNVPANDLPVVDENDAGKVLTVNDDGKWEAETPAQPTPELPSVDAEDAGKVLTVSDDGVWEAETPSGGGGGMVLHVTENEEHTAYYLDKTWGEIKNALEGGSLPYIILNSGDGVNNDIIVFEFQSMGNDSSVQYEGYGITFRSISVDEEGNIGNGRQVVFVCDSADDYPYQTIST